jgi:hypothetical protein
MLRFKTVQPVRAYSRYQVLAYRGTVGRLMAKDSKKRTRAANGRSTIYRGDDATITRCFDCAGTGQHRGASCPYCSGTGKELWRACPRCGDIGFDKLPGGSFACRISCGYRWTADDPEWVIQRLPD